MSPYARESVSPCGRESVSLCAGFRDEELGMPLVKRFEDLEAWQAARLLAAAAYAVTRRRGFVTDPGLVDQFRRAAVSTMNNIAEGFDSGSRTEFRRFLRYAARSASEVQSSLYVARDQGYIDQASFAEAYALAQRVRQLCGGLIRRLSERAYSTSPRPNRIADRPAAYEIRCPPAHGLTGARVHRPTGARAHGRTAPP
ncbi:MAG: hypothetical protein A3J75_00225 [Acidobacteria bacterium RBG_16_68_9]|nr:MAG: hypothetical protein A3J75_00225 [Acidobacteria bacterium RBG_16_68_9]